MAESDRLIAEVAQRQHGTLHIRQLPTVTRHELHRRVGQGRLRREGRGVLVVCGSPDTWYQRLWVALHVAGSGTVIGRRSAARLHGLPGATSEAIDVTQPEATVPLAKPSTSRRTSLLPTPHLTTVNGFPVTTVERTLFDLAGLSSPQRRRRGWTYIPAHRVERMLDDALVRKQVTLASVAKVLLDLAGRGRPGTQLVRRLLDERTEDYVPTESQLEDLFVRFLTEHDLPVPRRQVMLGSETTIIGRVDFVYDDVKLVVELDSRKFHSQRSVTINDKRRDLQLLAAGWMTLRMSWWQLIDDGPMMARLLREVVCR